MYFDRKGLDGLMAYPTARLILATNQDPRFADRSKGIWRRMIVMPFRVNIPVERQDPKLASELKSELPGIFNWAVDGLYAVLKQQRFIIPKVCDEALRGVQQESNPAAEFLHEHYEEGTRLDSVICSVLYADYKLWCESSGRKPLDLTNFGKEVRKAFPKAERERDSKGLRHYRYVGLRPIEATATGGDNPRDPSVEDAEQEHL
jgi:putative DNA primase/helicase